MLTGKKLGQAIRAAIQLKGVSQKTVAAYFGVKPPSVQDWLNRGVIAKDKLPQLWAYFSDVVGPEHWGLKDSQVTVPPVTAAPPSGPKWPFRSITPEQWGALTPEERSTAEGFVSGLLAARNIKKSGQEKSSLSRSDSLSFGPAEIFSPTVT